MSLKYTIVYQEEQNDPIDSHLRRMIIQCGKSISKIRLIPVFKDNIFIECFESMQESLALKNNMFDYYPAWYYYLRKVKFSQCFYLY